MVEHSNESRIMIVDDTPQNIQVLGTVLREQGYQLSVARNGRQALEAAQKIMPDLILLDVMMPELDGFETCRRLKDDPRTRDIPVIFLTAKTELEDIVKGFNLGGVDYVTKPFNTAELLARVKTHLTLRALQEHLEQVVQDRTSELRQTVKELQARDRLLKHLLYLNRPDETLVLAIQTALDLCVCDAGALYMPDAEGNMVVKAAVGYHTAGVPETDPSGLKLTVDVEAIRGLQDAAGGAELVLLEAPGKTRQACGIHSAGLVTICRGDRLLAVLEVGRTLQAERVAKTDLEALQEFLPYVAMAVVDCKLQEERPEWGDDVDEILKKTEEWFPTETEEWTG